MLCVYTTLSKALRGALPYHRRSKQGSTGVLLLTMTQFGCPVSRRLARCMGEHALALILSGVVFRCAQPACDNRAMGLNTKCTAWVPEARFTAG